MEEILKFCYLNDCSPSTIVFEDRISFDNLDDIIENWNDDVKSFMDPTLDLKKNYRLYCLRTIVLGRNPPENSNVDISRYEEERSMFHKAHELLWERDVTLPGISLVSYRVDCDIRPVDLDTIFKEFMFPTLIYNGMRKIPSTSDKRIPEWFVDGKAYNYGSVYTRVGGMTVRIRESKISFKYNKGISLGKVLKDITSPIRSEVLSVAKSKFVSMATVNMNKPWKRHVMADIITNNKKVNQIMSILEISRPLYKKKYITSLCMFCKFTIIDDDEIRVRISSPTSTSDIKLVLSMIVALFQIYDESYDRINKIYSQFIKDKEEEVHTEEKAIKALRKKDPGLFISNYTRECPVLPIAIDEEATKTLKRPYIFYHNRYYTSPHGFFVGLKVNRLSNKDKYKYLVTAYKTNHLLRKSSATYKYVYGEEPTKTISHSNTRRIYSSEYDTIKSESFLGCIEAALGSRNFHMSKYFVCCKQELWFMDLDEIASNISKDNTNSSYYRYYEELYSCNIIVMRISRGRSDVLIPDHRGKYIWNPYESSRGILIIEVPSPVHIKGDPTYELVVGDFNMRDDNIFSKLAKRKASLTFRGIKPLTTDASYQHINHEGKCVMVKDDKKEYRCHTVPLGIKTYEPYGGIVKEHFQYANEIRRENNMKTLMWEESNSKYIYFPNLESTIVWKE